jgi:hypothetical protein
MYANNYAQHIAEVIAETEGIGLDMVDVQIEYDANNVMEPVITMTTDTGKWTAKMHDGESLKDLQWKEIA